VTTVLNDSALLSPSALNKAFCGDILKAGMMAQISALLYKPVSSILLHVLEGDGKAEALLFLSWIMQTNRTQWRFCQDLDGMALTTSISL
jgi:hypothetical protein